MNSSKAYYRVYLGEKSMWAEQCFAGGFIDTDFEPSQDLTNDLPDAGHLGGRIELALAFARLRGEVTHEVFVRIATQIIALGVVRAEIKRVEDANQLRDARETPM